MVSLLWMEGRISDKLLILLNGINGPTPIPNIAPSQQCQVKEDNQCTHIPYGQGWVGCISMNLDILCKVFLFFYS